MPDRIKLQLDKNKLSLAPGDSAEVNITLTNRGDVVDAFAVSVLGLDASWYALSTEEVRLFPKYSSEVILTLRPPKGGGALAGGYSFSVLAVSQDNPLESASEVVTILLSATGGLTLGLEPARIVGREGLYALILTNAGNSEVSTVLEASDPDEGMRYTLGTPKTLPVQDVDKSAPRPPLGKAEVMREGRIEHELEVPVGSVVTVPLLVKLRKRIWVGKGRAVELPFVVGAHPPGVEWEPSEAKKASGVLAYKPVFRALAGLPLSMQRALGVLFLLVVLALLVGLAIAGSNTLGQNNAANANASATQTAQAEAAQKTATAAALSAAATQTANAANAHATETALAGVEDTDSSGGLAFQNNFRLRLPQGGDGASNTQPDFVWDVTSAQDVKINQATRQLVIPNLETSRLVDYSLQATGSNYVLTNTSSLLFLRPPRVELFSGDPITVTLGQTTTLSWRVKSASAGLVDGATADLGPQGSGQVVELPTMTHRYILCASNQAGSACRSVKIWVLEGGDSGFGPSTDRTLCVPTTVNVTIKNGTFDLKNLVVTTGSALRWVNKDQADVTFSGSSALPGPSSGIGSFTVAIPPGTAYQRTFSTPGTFTYRIGAGPGQAGIVKVVAPCTATPTGTPTPTRITTPGVSTATGTRTAITSSTPTGSTSPTRTSTTTSTPTATSTLTLTLTPSPTGTAPRGTVRTPTRTYTYTHTATRTNTATYTYTLTPTLTMTYTPTPTYTPAGNAYLGIAPVVGAGPCVAPGNGGTTYVGCSFTLDLVLYPGSQDPRTQWSYMTFTNQLLQNTIIGSTQAGSCVPITTVTGIHYVFDIELQNQVCNGPAPCSFGGTTVAPGSIAYGSRASQPCFEGCESITVAEINLCAFAPGRATIHWQFSPPAPSSRDTRILDSQGVRVNDPRLFTSDYVINIADSTPVPVRSITPGIINSFGLLAAIDARSNEVMPLLSDLMTTSSAEASRPPLSPASARWPKGSPMQQPSLRTSMSATSTPGAAESFGPDLQIFSVALILIGAIMLIITALMHIRTLER